MKHCFAGLNAMCREAEPRTAEEIGCHPAEGVGSKRGWSQRRSKKMEQQTCMLCSSTGTAAAWV